MMCCLDAFGKSNIVKFPWSECEDDIVDDDELDDMSRVLVCGFSMSNAWAVGPLSCDEAAIVGTILYM